MGPSGVGKSQVIKGLLGTGRFRCMRSYTTRNARVGESVKITVTKEFLEDAYTNNMVSFRNTFFDHEYALSSLEVLVSTQMDNHFVVDFGYQNWEQIKDINGVIGIVILPSNETQLRDQLIASGRCHRIEHALDDYRDIYSNLELGYSKLNNIHVLINKPKEVTWIIDEIVSIILGNQSAIDSKSQRMAMAWRAYDEIDPRPCNGLEAYCRLSDCLNKVEDELVGHNDWETPESFKGFGPTRRLYPIAPESYFDVPNWKGISAFESRRELSFVSLFGAIAVYERDRATEFTKILNDICTSPTNYTPIWESGDFWGDGVWHKKNKL